MLEEIIIRDLGVISEARLQLGPGFNALTGETGAGKTMILTALGLLLGERADSTSVRKGQAQSQVHGLWKLEGTATGARVSGILTEANLEHDLGELIVSRSVNTDGKSRATISAQPVPAGFLQNLGEELVVVHGQSEQLRLKSATAQREALDGFAGAELAEHLAEYRDLYHRWLADQARLAELKASVTERERETEELRLALKGLDDAQPAVGEDVELADLAERLTNLEGIRFAVGTAHEALSAEEDGADVLGLLSGARRALEAQLAFEPRLQPIVEQLREINSSAREVAGELASMLASLESDSELSLDAIQARRAVLNALMRKHGPSLEEVIGYWEYAQRRLSELEGGDEHIEALEASVLSQREALISRARAISSLRALAAASLATQVTAELHSLAMPGATLVVSVEPAELGPEGADKISIQLSAYPGADPRPLGKGASGGELSRIMLAIEVVLANSKTTPTFIFDEVDAGVGGAAAIEIGKRLAKLAKTAQVIVVTHLAQVAAFADNHLRVQKNQAGEFTSSAVVALSEVERVEELARMLSGLTDSELGLAHAAELWQSAKLAKNS